MTNTNKRLVKVISEQMGCEPHTITAEADLVKDLGMDSLDTLEAAMAIEDEFGIEITDEELEGLRTVAQVQALVERKCEDCHVA